MKVLDLFSGIGGNVTILSQISTMSAVCYIGDKQWKMKQTLDTSILETAIVEIDGKKYKLQEI